MSITLRRTTFTGATNKGSALTHAEMDANFTSFMDTGGSALVGFIQSGSGASGTTAQTELRYFIRPEQFGAVGDGATDDTAAIIEALAAAAGKTLLLDAKTYVLDSSDANFDPASNTLIKGSGRGATVLLFKNVGASNNGIYASQKTGIRIEGLTVKHSTAVTGNQGGIFLDDCDDCQIVDVQVENFDRGIWFYSTLANWTKNLRNKATRCYAKNAYGYGFHAFAATAHSWENCESDGSRNADGFKTGNGCLYPRIVNCYSRNNTRDGFDLYDGFIQGALVGCVAEGNTLNGFDIKGTSGGEYSSGDFVAKDSVCIGNVAEGNSGVGFLLTSIRAWDFSGCMSVGNTLDGWQLDTVQGCAFSACTALRNTEHGWELDSASRNTFTSCISQDNSYVDGTTQNGTYHGWDLDASTINTFIGCTGHIGTQAGKKGGHGYGVNLDTSDSTNNVFIGQFFNSNVTGTFGGSNVETTNNVVSYIDTAHIGVQVLSTGEPGVYRSGANGVFSVERASGAKLNFQCQSSLGLIGTDSAHALRLKTSGTARWEVTTSGHLLALTDNTMDVGASGATRPRTGYFGTSVVTPLLNSTGAVQAYSATAIPAGGTTGSGVKVSSTANFGVFFGSGAPTLSAAQGSLYLRSDGSGTGDRAYINTDGSTTWTALTTAA